MLSLLINRFKKILKILLVSALIIATMGNTKIDTPNKGYQKEYCSYRIIETWQQRECDIIIRVGEYEGKAGKRIYVNNEVLKLPNDIPVRNDRDGKGFYISEYDINVKQAKAIYNKLKEKGVPVKLQIAKGKSEDLNAAARLSNKSNPKLYLSIHHNYYDSNSTGYFAMYNTNDATGRAIASQLSSAIQNNGLVPQRASRPNTNGYIGELTHIHNSTVPILMEMGFFSNLDELQKICSDKYVEYTSTQLSNEIVNILNSYWSD